MTAPDPAQLLASLAARAPKVAIPTTMARNLQLIGLIYNLAAIGVLGGPEMCQMVEEIAAQSATKWNANLDLAKALAKARTDTTVGSLIPILGFATQAASLYVVSATPLVWAILALLVVFLITYWCSQRDHSSKGLMNRVQRRIESVGRPTR